MLIAGKLCSCDIMVVDIMEHEWKLLTSTSEITQDRCKDLLRCKSTIEANVMMKMGETFCFCKTAHPEELLLLFNTQQPLGL